MLTAEHLVFVALLLALAAAAFLVWELFPPDAAEEPPVPAERERVGVG